MPRRSSILERPELTPELFANYLSGDRVQVIVGPEAKVFKLPKGLLTCSSPHMAAGFGGRFIEGDSGIMRLPEVTVRSFELAITSMFSIDGRIPKTDISNFVDGADFVTAMIELSSLGQLLLMPHLDGYAATSIRTLLLGSNEALGPQHVTQAFEMLEEKSETREAIVRVAFFHFGEFDWDTVTKDISNDWKFGPCLDTVPGFAAAVLRLQKDAIMGRIQV